MYPSVWLAAKSKPISYYCIWFVRFQNFPASQLLFMYQIWVVNRHVSFKKTEVKTGAIVAVSFRMHLAPAQNNTPGHVYCTYLCRVLTEYCVVQYYRELIRTPDTLRCWRGGAY
jgi:hypothetical protein